MEKDTAKQFPADGVYLIASIASVIFGIICISNPNEISRMVVLFAGLAVIVCGLIELYSFLIAKIKTMLVFATVMILAGIYCLVWPQTIEWVIGILIGLFLIGAGGVGLKKTLDLKKAALRFWWIELIFSMLVCAAGVHGLLHPYTIAGLPAVLAGAGFLISGISNICVYFMLKPFFKNRRMQ